MTELNKNIQNISVFIFQITMSKPKVVTLDDIIGLETQSKSKNKNQKRRKGHSTCAVGHCPYPYGTTFFRFPDQKTEPIRFEQWWKFCDRKDTKYKTHHKVCNLHFPENCFGENVKVLGFHPPKIYTGINISHENQNFSGID